MLTGEDLLFYTMLVNGGEGGITASAHLHTEDFVTIYKAVKTNDHLTALETWRRICGIVSLLFEEPNPGPIKYLLHRKGRLGSDAVRLPLTGISDQLKQKLDHWCAQTGG